ncbi:MAG: 4Fe-4S binding protein [Candidatus Wallbacteria bacterium]|nr:4Fe-4S binding protein [Candidatus Wallbacteria bacterium]
MAAPDVWRHDRLAERLLALGLVLTIAGFVLGDWGRLARQMAYGDYPASQTPAAAGAADYPISAAPSAGYASSPEEPHASAQSAPTPSGQNYSAFVQRLWTGTPDLAATKSYRTMTHVEVRPLAVLALIFAAFYWLVRWRNPDVGRGVRRWLTYWLTFVGARLGVLRVAGVAAVPRCAAGSFPFLNCQACEMATGACPVGAVQSAIVAGRFPYLAVGSVLATGAVLGRTVCGWLCPFGMLADIAERFSLRRVQLKAGHWALRFVVLGAVLALPAWMYWRGDTGVHAFCATLCPSGLVYGLLPYYATTGKSAVAASWATLGVVGFHVLVAAVFVFGFFAVSGWLFCHALCPLGAALGLFNRVAMVRVEHDTVKCTGCNKCVAACPVGIQLGDESFLARTSCIACARCIPSCGEGARYWYVHPALEAIMSRVETVRTILTGGEERPALSERAEHAVEDRRARSRKPYGVSFRGRIIRRLLRLLAARPEAMASYAKYATVFYRRLYAGLDERDFESLPILRKETVRDVSPYDLLASDHWSDAIYYGETTGSLGSPTPCFYTEREFRSARRLAHLSAYGPYLEGALQENRSAVNGLAFGFTIAGMTFGDVLQNAGALVANVGSRSTLATPDRIARALVRLRPSVVAAAPIDFLCWARIARDDFPDSADRALGRLRVLMSTAELCSRERQKRIEEHFGLVQINTYACVEGFFALACPCGEQHVLDAYHTEVFDDALTHSSEYGTGRFVFTNLIKRSSPMIRYLLDDQVTIAASDCRFGYRKSIYPHGRWELSAMLGRERVNVAEFEDAIFRHGLFGDYRVHLHEDRLQVELEDYAAGAEAAERARVGLEARFSLPCALELVPFGKLTAYREVRQAKPILKLVDHRVVSTQRVPEVV